MNCSCSQLTIVVVIFKYLPICTAAVLQQARLTYNCAQENGQCSTFLLEAQSGQYYSEVLSMYYLLQLACQLVFCQMLGIKEKLEDKLKGKGGGAKPLLFAFLTLAWFQRSHSRFFSNCSFLAGIEGDCLKFEVFVTDTGWKGRRLIFSFRNEIYSSSNH